jgi:hypothetical protein
LSYAPFSEEVAKIINNFIRFAEVLKLKEEKRIVSVTLRPLIADCTGEIYFTDLQLQEGDKLTGYTPHTTVMLRSSGNTPRYQNAVVRGSATLVLFNTGETSAGLDLYIYPKQTKANITRIINAIAGEIGAFY